MRNGRKRTRKKENYEGKKKNKEETEEGKKGREAKRVKEDEFEGQEDPNGRVDKKKRRWARLRKEGPHKKLK